jgi:hypothetical protein
MSAPSTASWSMGKGVVVDANKTVGSNPNWLKKNRFRQEFNDRMRAAPVDFVRS